MGKVNLKKLTAVTLALLMLLPVIVSGTSISAVTAEPIYYPAPEMSENPQLLKEFSTTPMFIPAPITDAFALPKNVTGLAEEGAPIISTITEHAGPNDSVSIYGVGLEAAKVYAYGLADGKGAIKELNQTSNKEGFINAVIDKNFDYGMYIIWVQGADGKVSAPVRVNAPKLTWVSATKASANIELRVYGKFLTTENADGSDAKSYVYLTNGSSYYKATVLEATPYKLTIKLPSSLTNDQTYSLFVHNGHGGDYGWSNSLSVTYNEKAEKYWNDTKITVKVTDGFATDDDIRNAINNASAGSTIYLPAGTYVIRDKISVSKSLRFVGEDKDKVLIVGVFAQTKKTNDALAYGDLNVNGSCTPAFDVTTTPCEFSNLSFTEFVENSSLYSGISAPSDYDIDYAHGMFIKGHNASVTGAAAQLKIDNCSFIVQRTYSDVTNCGFLSAAEEEENHQLLESKYQYYSRKRAGSAPLWITADYTEITNCYFETPRGLYTRAMHNSYIHGNTFVGTWVMAGNSGSSAILDNNTQNLEISNNRVYGMDEVTDPDGCIVTGDMTFGRVFCFQKALGLSKNQYIMNNVASRVGELNYGSGEHILFEDENVTYVGKATLSNNNKTLHLKDMPDEKWVKSGETYEFHGYVTGDDGKIKPNKSVKKIEDQVVVITKGRGQGQWRMVVSALADRTVTIDRDWDVQPDENSTFVVVPAFVNPIVYKNTIEGPQLYYKNYNSTNGVNAYASMMGTVIDRNNFSQMQIGLALNTRYNIKSYTYNDETVSIDFGFVMFCEMLVMNNTISNTRYGIWNFPSITMASMDASDAEPETSLELCSIIRNNNISNSRRLTGGADTNDTVDSNLIKRGGVSIVVGRDYWAKDHILSTRYWLQDIVVENNILSDVENKNGNGFIDVGFSQKDTVLRNNVCDGEVKETYLEIEVERNIQTHNSKRSPSLPIYVLSPITRIANNHFDEDLKFWSGIDGINYASTYAVAENGVATIKKGKGNGLKTAPFNIPLQDISSVVAENKIAFIVKYTGGSSAFNVELFVNGIAQGNAKSAIYSSGKSKLFYYDNLYWNENSTYQLAISSYTGTSEIGIDCVDMARYETIDAVLDIVSGRVYGNISDDITDDFTNTDFTSGLDGWEKASSVGSVTVADGVVNLYSSKIQSDYFQTQLKEGDSVAILYDFNSVTNAKLSLKRKDINSDGTVVDTVLIDAVGTRKTGLAATAAVVYKATSSADTYLSIIVEGSVALDSVTVATISGSGINLVYTDIVTGKRYLSDMRDPDGTEQEGFEKLNQRYANGETYAINETLMNGDFSEGLKYWSAAINSRTTSTMTANAADCAKKVENGVVTIIPSSNGGRGISTAHFRVPNADKHSKFVIAFDYAHTVGSDTTSSLYKSFKIEVFKGGASHTSVKSLGLSGTNGAWKTCVMTVNITDPQDCYVLSLEGFNTKTEFKLKNVRLIFEDEGGEGDYINLDGSLVGYEYGDVNKDGEVNLLDYARMVKFMAGVEGTTMYKAAGNLDKDANITVDANDLTYLKEYLVSGNKNF